MSEKKIGERQLALRKAQIDLLEAQADLFEARDENGLTPAVELRLKASALEGVEAALKLIARVHVLKSDPEFFHTMMGGEKTCELRPFDRDYRVGDMLILRETEFTGEEMAEGAELIYTDDVLVLVIRDILSNFRGLADGWCAMSIGGCGEFSEQVLTAADEQGLLP